MKTIVIASSNSNKIREIKKIIELSKIRWLSVKNFPHIGQIPEYGKTYKENALIKAKKVTEYTHHWTLADDSGLEVEILRGKPGIKSARFAGENGDSNANNKKLLTLIKGKPKNKRKASFHCILVLYGPHRKSYFTEGVIKGIITEKPYGKNGFGYDPIFYYSPYKQTFAQISAAKKNKVSHRARALKKMQSVIKKVILKDK